MKEEKCSKTVNKGFTLIELLVVVLIIGIITAIALPMYKKAVEKSKVTDALSTMSAVSKSEGAWYLLRNNYTQDFADLDIDLTDKDGKKAEDASFESINYTFTLQDTGIKAERKNKEYVLYQDYETKQIMCLPSKHYICDNLGNFTKISCENAGLTWANTGSTCYASEEARCNGLNPGKDLWNDSEGFCGYTNTREQTLNEGLICEGTQYSGCNGSIINEGGHCIGNFENNSCRRSIINSGGVCTATGSGHHGACALSTVNEGGICIAESQDGCAGSTINKGGICWAKGGGDYEHKNYMCKDVILDGGICIGRGNGYGSCISAIIKSSGECKGDCYYSTVSDGGICSGGCSSATINDGGICSGECSYATINDGGVCSGGCSSATINDGGVCKSSATNKCGADSQGHVEYYGTGCCEGDYCGSRPKCNCPIDEATGMHKTSC